MLPPHCTCGETRRGVCAQAGVDFEEAADAYVRPFLTKGIPSLFSDLKTLYRCAPAPVSLSC